MNAQDLQTMIDYHYWARDRMLEAIEPLTPEQYTRDLGNSFKSIRDTATHIYGAEWVWYARWHGEAKTALPATDTFSDLAGLRRAWAEHEPKMRAFVNGLDEAGLSRMIDYTLFNGTKGASPIWQMVQHVVNHASYHRGQITTMLRQLGAQPGKSMDMIAYFRAREVKA